MIKLTLPYPISANRYWRQRVPRGSSFAITYPSPEAVDYKREVARIANAAGVTPIPGAVEYEMDLYPALPQNAAARARVDPLWWWLGVRCIDLDNARKVLLDALNGIAWQDDVWIVRDSARRMVPDGEARVVLRITRYKHDHAQMALLGGEGGLAA